MASYPILYPASINAISDIYNAETDSYALGYGALSNAISTSTVSSINDSYEFSMEYPVEDSFLFQNLVVGNKILAEHDCTGDLQLFEIRDTSYSLSKDTLNVECVHVSYATDGIICCPDQTMMADDNEDIKQYASFVECTSLQAASKWITDNAKGVNPFTLDVTAHYGNHLHNSRVPLTEEAFDKHYHANQYYINNSSVLEVTSACPAPCLGRTKLWANNSWTLSIDLKGGETATISALYFEKEDSTEPVRNVVVNTFDTTLSWQRYKTDEIFSDEALPYVVIQISGVGVEARLWMLEETRAYSGHWEESNNDKYWRFQSAPITYRKALNGDEETSLVATYGGELLFDNYNIRLLSRLGQDRGLTIRYAKNLQDLTDETDGTNIFGGVVPYYTDGNGTCHWFGSKGSSNGKNQGIVYSDWYDPNDPLRRRLCILDVTEHFAPQYDQANKGYQSNIDAAQADVDKYSNELTRISARLQAYNDAKSKAKDSKGVTYAAVSYEIDGIPYSESAGPYDEAGWENQVNIMTYSQKENENWQKQAQSILEKAQKDQERMKTWEPNLSSVISYCKAYLNENNAHRTLRNLEIKIQNEDPEIGVMNSDVITLGDTATLIGDMYPPNYNNGYWTDYIPTVPNMDYTFYAEPSALRIGDQVKVLWYDENKVVIDDNWTITATKADEERNHLEGYYICPNSASYVRVCWPKFWGTSIADLGFMHNGVDDLPNTTISEVPGDTPMQYISRVIELDWNMLEGCYNSITLGDAQEKLTNILTDGVSSAVGRANAIIIQAANNAALNNVAANNNINRIDSALTETRNNLTQSITSVNQTTQAKIERSDEEIQRINELAAETAENVSAQAEQIREVIQEATNITEELHDSVDSLSADILAVAQDADALSEEMTEKMQAVDTNIADIQSRIDGVVALSDDLQAQINELELEGVDPETLAEAIETVRADIPTDEKIQQLASLKDEELAAVITAYVQNGFVSNEDLAEADFATELWVENQDYATESYADGKASTAKSEAISAAASDATTKANNAKSSAISTAASDATTKANNAKNDAISAASTDATNKANAAEAAAKAYSDTLKSDLQTQIDGKIETFAQDADPSTSWTTTAMKNEHKGDIWYCTKSTDTTHYQKTWRWTGSSWVQISAVPDSIIDKIDGKAQIFYQASAPTSGMNAKDYWIDSDADGKPTYIYYNNQWIKVSDYNAAIAAAKSEAISAAASDAATKAAAAQAAAISAAAQDASSKAQSARENAIIDTKAWVNNQDYATETYADGKASTAKSEAISAAATDATTKANNAKSSAISTAAADATSKANAAEAAAKAYVDNLITDLEADIDGMISTYSQAVDPSTGWPTSDYAKHAGDIWYCTDSKNTAKYQLCWRWTGSAWTAFSGVPDTVIDKIDGKTTTFYQNSAPASGMQKNDIWIDADDLNKSSYIYSGTAWVKASDYTVGGRNYFDWGTIQNKSNITYDDSNYSISGTMLNVYNAFGKNSGLLFAFPSTGVFSCDVASWTTSDSMVGKVGARLILRKTDGTTAKTLISQTYQKLVTGTPVTFTHIEAPITSDIASIYVTYSSQNNTCFCEIKNLKFETGNVATDWTPNPDYTTEYIDAVTDAAKSDAISTAAADATTKANNAQSTAISTAAADATTKANNAKSSAISETKTWVNQQGFGSANDIATLRASLLETTNTVASNKTELLAKFDNYVATGDLNDAITRTDIMQATEASLYDLEFAQGKYLARKCRLVMPNAWGANANTQEQEVVQRATGNATEAIRPYSKLKYWYTSDVSIGTLSANDLWWQYDEDWYLTASEARQIAAYKFKDSDGVMHISDPCTMIQCRFNTANYPDYIKNHIWNFTLQEVNWSNYNTASARPTSWTYHAQIDSANVNIRPNSTDSAPYTTKESMDLIFTLSSAGALKVRMYYISDRYCPLASSYNGNKSSRRWHIGTPEGAVGQYYIHLSEIGDQFHLMWEEFFYRRTGALKYLSTMSTDENWTIGNLTTWTGGHYNANAGMCEVYAWAELCNDVNNNKYAGMYCPFRVIIWVDGSNGTPTLKAMVPHMRRQYEDYASAHDWKDVPNFGFNAWFIGWGSIAGLREDEGLYP